MHNQERKELRGKQTKGLFMTTVQASESTDTFYVVGFHLENGQRYRLFGVLDDQEYTQKVPELPPGFCAWHLQRRELEGGRTVRAEAIWQIPVYGGATLYSLLRDLKYSGVFTAEDFVRWHR